MVARNFSLLLLNFCAEPCLLRNYTKEDMIHVREGQNSSVPVELCRILARLLHLVIPPVHRTRGALGAGIEVAAVVGLVSRRHPPPL